MNNIPEVENEEVDEIFKESEEPLSPDTKILERSIKILNEKLEKVLDKEEMLTKELNHAHKETSEYRNKLNESNLSYEKKVKLNMKLFLIIKFSFQKSKMNWLS